MTAAPAATAAPAHAAAPAATDPRTVRVGVVRYLNTLPLIDGLAGLRGVELLPDVPARLVDHLAAGRVDMALCSSVDFLRSPVPLQVVPVGMLGCRGETMTVRIYSKVPLAQVRTLAADSDSHTSRALAQVILARRFGARAQVTDYDRARGPRDPGTDAMLLIGDKVVTDAPDAAAWPHQLDLGEAWHAWTGLPFVFATWFVRAERTPADEARLRTVARVLDHQRRHNRERIDGIVAREAAPHGWPQDAARRYLGELLRFDLDAGAREGLERFHAEVVALGLADAARPITYFA